MQLPYPSLAERRKRRHNLIWCGIFIGLLVLTFIISMNTGFIRLTPVEVFQTMMGQGTPKQELILFQLRTPRIIIAVLVGAALALSGCVLQSITRNALADPGILGINAGAGLVVLLFMAYVPSQSYSIAVLLPVLAWLGAGGTAILIYVLSYHKEEGFSPKRLLLSGIGVASGISAITIIVTLQLTPEKYLFVAMWMAGSIWGTSWKFVLAFLPYFLLLFPFVWSRAKTLNVMNLGDHLAVGLGTNLKRERFILLAAAVGLAGAAVSISGGIGFVGLIAPHLVRRLIGGKHQMVIPITALAGGLLVLVADTIGRSIIQPNEIPAGIVVAIIGAPYFLYLLSRRRMTS